MKEPKKELAGVKEIAKRANVSIATVDRVIHNRIGVSEQTKDKIQAIIKELNYQPNILARRLASRNVLNFAVLIPEVSSETAFWEAPLNGVLQAQSEIERFGINITKYFFDQNNKRSFAKQADLILKNKVDGILIAPSFIDESVKFTASCKDRKIPYVFINSDIPNQDSLCYIGPNLFHSGYLGAHLMNYLLRRDEKILVVNISREIDTEHHLLRKEEGFRAYFRDNNLGAQIIKIDIQKTDYLSVKKELLKVLKTNPDIQAMFVTNSRVSSVARFLEESSMPKPLLVGFDFLPENVEFLKRDVIDFLICQKPQEQGYRGIMALYQKLVHAQDVEKIHFMPIDIITRENYQFYNN